MNNINDNDKLQAMFKAAAEKLGTDAESLRSAAQKGDMQKLLTAEQNKKIGEILSDPEKARKLLSSKQAKDLMRAMGISENKEK